MLQVPDHIARANIATQDVKFAWDEWRTKSYYWDVPQALFDRLNALSDDASMSLALAIAEWVVHRFSRLDNDPFAPQFLEAAWAGTVHPAYCIYTETVDDEWRGPVRGPLAVTIAIVNDGLFCRDNDPEVATRACWMHRLATHVLPDTADFDRWFENSVQRLERFHPRTPAPVPTSFFDLNLASMRPVPRQAFEPSFAYAPDRAPALVDAFLKSLNVRANPCLRSPEELADISELKMAPYAFPS